MSNVLKEVIRLSVLAGFLVVAQSFAFSEPGVLAPGGVAVAPVNVGGAIQEKSAMFAATQLLSRGSAWFATSGGSVGIGTVSPAQKLDVVGGEIHATGDICTDAGGGKCLSGGGGGGGGNFAGMFWVRTGNCSNLVDTNPNPGNFNCRINNFYTGGCSCPSGFTAHIASRMCGGFPDNYATYYCSKP